MIFTDKAAKEKIAQLEERVAELETDNNSLAALNETLVSESATKDQTIAENVAVIAAKDEAIANIEAKLADADRLANENAQTIADLQNAVDEAKASAGKQTVEVLAAIGQPEPLATGNVDETGPVDHIANLAKLTGSERTAYYAEHGKEIRKQLSK